MARLIVAKLQKPALDASMATEMSSQCALPGACFE
jgi:hypothetical protein